MAQLVFQPALIISASPLLGNSRRVEPGQIFKLVCVCLHSQVPVLECEEFRLSLMPGTGWKIFFQKSLPGGSSGNLLTPSLHELLHACPPVFRICYQQESDE